MDDIVYNLKTTVSQTLERAKIRLENTNDVEIKRQLHVIEDGCQLILSELENKPKRVSDIEHLLGYVFQQADLASKTAESNYGNYLLENIKEILTEAFAFLEDERTLRNLILENEEKGRGKE